MLIMEYAPHGSLLKFLRERRPIYQPNWQKTVNNPNEEFTLVDLLMTAYQIARGMEFLASKKVSISYKTEIFLSGCNLKSLLI